MEYEIRRYRIADGRLEAFVDMWRTGVMPLRERLGFTVVGAWALADTNEFVWILGYDGPGGFAEADQAYYRSNERAGLDPDPARFIVEVTEAAARRIV